MTDRLPTFTDLIDLATERAGGAVLLANDEFFAPKENLVRAEPPVWRADEYTERGKWMDGWETRRRRGSGHDWCVVRLARPGRVHGVDLDTSHFTGNFPPAASLEGCRVDGGDPGADTQWLPLVPAVDLHGNRHHYLAVANDAVCTHVRINLFPDGGLARFRVLGELG